MAHGTRANYQHGCRCTPCKAANAQYQLTYRGLCARNIPRPCAVVSSRPARRLLTGFRREWLSQYRLAHELGKASHSLRIQPKGITRTKLAAIERLARFYEIAS